MNPTELDHSPLNDWVPTEVHDWEGKETNVLVLNYTMACPLQCDFCCYGCHPQRTEKMPLELAFRLIKEAAELGKFSSIGFTGGEPMLFLDELLQIGRRLKGYGLPFTIATAAHWAKSEKRAHEILEELAKVGLCRLNVSYDPSHAKFIPKKSILSAITASSHLGIPTYVVGTFYSAFESMENYLPEASDLAKVTLVTKYVSGVGRAASRNITQSSYGLSLGLEALSCYRRIYHDMVVWHDGTVYPCCSTFNRATPGISIGNANVQSLRELWSRLDGSLMYRVMKRHGFERFYAIVKRLDPALYELLPSSADCVGPCSLCHSIFKDSEMAQRISKVFDAYEQEKIDRSIDMLSNLLGEEGVIKVIEEALCTESVETETNQTLT